LTKRFEEVRRGSLADLAEAYVGNPARGEIVVVVGRPPAETVTSEDVEAALREAMVTMRVKDAAAVVAGALGRPKREVYQIALHMGDAKDGSDE
jgi:16S rRNA (cytidine1402-2'-O)-methyltransferase